MASSPWSLNTRRFWMVVFALISLGIIGGGLAYYRYEQNKIRQNLYQDLAAIADLKIKLIEGWRRERLGDANNLTLNPFLRQAVATWLQDPGNSGVQSSLLDLFKHLHESYGYENILLVAPTGKILLSLRPHPASLGPGAKRSLDEAISGRQAILGDLFLCPNDDRISLDAAAPILDPQGRILAVVLLRINPRDTLYPLIQTWPTPSLSAETLLVKLDGKNVLFLNDLRHRENTALSLRVPLSHPGLPAEKAALGQTGMFEGRDYRDQEVLADLRPVPHWPWFMVTKADRVEILAEARYRLVVTFLCVILFILLTGTAVSYAYRQRQFALLTDLQRTEREREQAEYESSESEKHYRMLFNSIDEGFCIIEVIFDENEKPIDYRFLEINPAFEKQTGLIDAQGKRMRQLAPKHEDHWFEIYGKIAVTGQPVRFVNRAEQLHRWYDVYAFRYGQPENRQVAILFNDITERKGVEATVAAERQRFFSLLEAMPAYVGLMTPDYHVAFANRYFQERFGEPEGRRCYEYMFGRSEPCENCQAYKVLETKTPEEYEWLGPDGRTYQICDQLVHDTDGSPLILEMGIDITERKRAEENLKHQIQFTETLLETIPSPVFYKDVSGRYLGCNRAFEEFWGKRRETVIGKDVYEMGPKEIADKYAEMDQELFERLGSQMYEWKVMAADGLEKEVIFYKASFPDATGKVGGLIGVILDITERKRAEEALNESEKKYRLLVNQIPAVVFQGYGDWSIDFFDNKIEILSGYTKEEFDSRKITWCDLILPEDLDNVRRIFIEALKTNKSYVREYRIRRKDGEIRWVQSRGQIFCDAEGNVEYISGVTFDITEPKRAHESLRRAKEEWELTFDAVPDLIAILDTQHRIVRVNRAMADRLGVTPEAAIGSFCYEVVHHLKSPPGFCPHLQLLKDGRGHQAEVHEPALGGDFLVTVSPLYNHEGHLSGSVHVAHDLSERKQTERERLRLAKLEAVGVLAGGIAHDFNNVLMGVLGNISLASMASSASEAHERLVAAEAACGQAQSLAQQLLTFAKGGAPVKKPQNLKEIVQGVAKMALSGSQSRVELSLPDQLWYVEVDRSQMEQVFSNLFINADQAMPTGGLIQVEAENLEVTAGSRLPLSPGKYVMVTLKDQGIGISPELLERIFDPYFTTKQKGSGLGLATTLSIVTQHGGYIMVDSQLGRGAIFRLYLPAQDEAGLPEKPVEAKPLEGHGRILVMDDDPLVREVMDKMLRKLGYEPVFAQEGREALELYARGQASGEPFAAVILDLTIPGGMGGTEAIQHLLAQDPQVKAVVSSGYADNTIMADFKTYGFQGVIAKPYRMADLARVLQEVLNLSFSATLD